MVRHQFACVNFIRFHSQLAYKHHLVIGKKLLRSRDITWHGHLREKVKFLVSVRVVVRVMVRVRVEC